MTRPGLLLAVGLAAGCSANPPPALTPTPATAALAGWFRDVTAASGVDAVYRNGEEADRFAILESLGGGVAVLDFDGDGKLDLFFPGGGRFDGPDKKTVRGLPPKLYRNLGGLRFEDVTAGAGLATLAGGADWFYSHGASVTDYDRDGWPDLLVTGYGRVALFHNEPDGKGGRRFVEVTAKAGLLGDHLWATGAAWADFDGDGWPDLYVCNYVDWSNANDPACPALVPGVAREICDPRKFAARPHRLFRNNGDGTFADVTLAAGVRADRPDGDYGKGLGVLAADFDGDGRPDLYVANDSSGNFLYLNRSRPGEVRLEEVGMKLGVARDGGGMPTGSMGLDAVAFDADPLPSVWVTNYENEYHALYRNQSVPGRPQFRFFSPGAGVTALGPVYVGWGTAFADFDRDGWDDLAVVNGHVARRPPKDNLAQPPVLMRNLPRGDSRGLADARPLGGPYFQAAHRGRGLAVADLDDDGRPDLVVSHVNQPAAVLRNETPDAHWVGVRLIGRDRRDVVGAAVTLEAGGRPRTRFALSGRSYLSASDPRLLFGLGETVEVGRVTVRWPGSPPAVEHFDGLAADRYHTLTEGAGMP